MKAFIVICLGAVAFAQSNSQTISYNDVLVVSVWKQPKLTNVLPVHKDGTITMPLLNDVKAVGLTTKQLESIIQSRLEEKNIRDPKVTIQIENLLFKPHQGSK